MLMLAHIKDAEHPSIRLTDDMHIQNIIHIYMAAGVNEVKRTRAA